MNSEFDDCLRRKRIREFSRGKTLVDKELRTAENDLADAKKSFNQQSYKWATIQSYYSMFHSGRALLYAKNYREKSHYCLIISLKALYVEQRLLPVTLIESLLQAKRLREQADYYDEWSQASAESLLNAAEKFLTIARQLTSKA
ncbi:MAG: HEPN domain-containing protein [Syntrophaceae bacterium]|nr:HEPN domain-containing protein [Syntrophaceae bacterium]